MIILYSAPALVISGICAWGIWGLYHTYPFGRITALFVLKPLLATPLFAMALLLVTELWSDINPSYAGLVALLPGVILTILLIRFGFRSLIVHPLASLSLLVGDIGRMWVAYRALISMLVLFNPGTGDWIDLLPLWWTSLYAILCWIIVFIVIRREPVQSNHPSRISSL